MSKKKGPFRGYTVEEVRNAEHEFFTILLGNDFYEYEGDMVFTLKEAQNHYEKLLKNINIALANGTSKEIKTALRCLEKLRIEPLRIH
jgi:hypothetical protein